MQGACEVSLEISAGILRCGARGSELQFDLGRGLSFHEVTD